MSIQIKLTLPDDILSDAKKCAAYRFGDSRTALAEYAKLATVQLIRRDVAGATKGPRRGKDTSDD